MRTLGNALVWVGMTIGLPGVLFAMTMTPNVEEPRTKPHYPEKCAVCRHYRGLKISPVKIDDDSMVLVSPGHPIVVAEAESDAE